MSVKPIPAGFHTVTPYMLVENATKFMAFLKDAFKAEEFYCLAMPDGTIMHAQVRIGDSPIMLAEKPAAYQAMPTMLYLYVADTDALYQQALRAGATSIREPVDQFYGDRSGAVQDAWGNQWWIATHIEDVSEKELMARAQKARKPA